MGHIVSASRRTDIPAFHSDWFMRRVAQRWAWSVNPFSGCARRVSLAPEQVAAIVFWSKDYRPLLPHLDALDAAGYRTLFHFTITGLPRSLEPKVPETGAALETMVALSRRYGPERVLWRFDPIVLSTHIDAGETLARFRRLAGRLEGVVTGCYISFVATYAKTTRNLAERGIEILPADREARLALAAAVVAAGREHGIVVRTCCGDELLAAGAEKAHCIDAGMINRLFGAVTDAGPRPTRRNCGCSASQDIGAYDTCRHACTYCYACTSPGKARAMPGSETE